MAAEAPRHRGRVLPSNSVHFVERRGWRRWLQANHRSATEVWLIYYRKGTGKPRISYNDAVEEALCFGWIDSNVKRLDDQRFAQRFTPRKPGSRYSQANKERLRRLLAEGRVSKKVLLNPRELREDALEIAPDILKAIKASRQAWRHFQRFSAAYKRIRIAFIEGARRRPPEFRKRLSYFVKMTEQNKQFGFGGIEKYY